MMEKCEVYKELVESHNCAIPDFVYIAEFMNRVFCAWWDNGNKIEKEYRMKTESGIKILIEID